MKGARTGSDHVMRTMDYSLLLYDEEIYKKNIDNIIKRADRIKKKKAEKIRKNMSKVFKGIFDNIKDRNISDVFEDFDSEYFPFKFCPGGCAEENLSG